LCGGGGYRRVKKDVEELVEPGEVCPWLRFWWLLGIKDDETDEGRMYSKLIYRLFVQFL